MRKDTDPMKPWNEIADFLSFRFYRREVPLRYKMAGAAALLLLIAVAAVNAYYLGLLASVLSGWRSPYVHALFGLAIFAYLLVSLFGYLAISRHRLDLAAFIYMSPYYLLVVAACFTQYSTLAYTAELTPKRLMIALRFDFGMTYNSIFLLLLVFQFLFHLVVFGTRGHVLSIVARDEEVRRSTGKADAYDSIREYILKDLKRLSERHSLMFIQSLLRSAAGGMYAERNDGTDVGSPNPPDVFREYLGVLDYVKDSESISEQMNIFSSIQHELGNKLPALKHDLNDLTDFLEGVETEQSGFLKRRTRSPLPGEHPGDIDTLEKLVGRMDRKVTYSIASVDSLGSLIKASPNSYRPEPTRLRAYLTGEREKSAGNGTRFRVLVEGDDATEVELDRKQFSFLVQNFISNAVRHGGFEGSGREGFILFSFRQAGGRVVLDVINNGRPLHPDYDIRQFLKPYNYIGETGNSGLGGYIIGIVLRNHKGEIAIADRSGENPEYRVCFRITLQTKNESHEHGG